MSPADFVFVAVFLLGRKSALFICRPSLWFAFFLLGGGRFSFLFRCAFVLVVRFFSALFVVFCFSLLTIFLLWSDSFLLFDWYRFRYVFRFHLC